MKNNISIEIMQRMDGGMEQQYENELSEKYCIWHIEQILG